MDNSSSEESSAEDLLDNESLILRRTDTSLIIPTSTVEYDQNTDTLEQSQRTRVQQMEARDLADHLRLIEQLSHRQELERYQTQLRIDELTRNTARAASVSVPPTIRIIPAPVVAPPPVPIVVHPVVAPPVLAAPPAPDSPDSPLAPEVPAMRFRSGFGIRPPVIRARAAPSVRPVDAVVPIIRNRRLAEAPALPRITVNEHEVDGIPCPTTGTSFEAKAIIAPCVICNHNQIQTVNFPCMHACFCLECVKPSVRHNNTCPQCREPYMNISMLYLSYTNAPIEEKASSVPTDSPSAFAVPPPVGSILDDDGNVNRSIARQFYEQSREAGRIRRNERDEINGRSKRPCRSDVVQSNEDRPPVM